LKPLFLLWVGETGRFNEKSVRVTGNPRKILNGQRQNVDYLNKQCTRGGVSSYCWGTDGKHKGKKLCIVQIKLFCTQNRLVGTL